MHLSRRARIGFGLLGAAAIGGTLPSGSASADDKPADRPITPEDVAAFANGAPQDLGLRDALTARYPDFGGFYVQEKSQVAVLLFRGAAPDAPEVAAIAGKFGFKQADYVIEQSEWSRADQLQLESHLINTYGAGKIAGTNATAVSFSVDDEFGTVNFGVMGASAETVRRVLSEDKAVEASLAEGRINLQEVDAPTEKSLWADRWSDTTPFNGGNLIYGDQACTSGWPVTKNGARSFLSAGHCGESKWFIDYPGTGTGFIGDSVGSSVGFGGSAASATADSQLIEGGSVNNKTWRDYGVRMQPVGTAMPGKGRVICWGGAATALVLKQAGGSEHELCGTIDVVDAVNNYTTAGDGWRMGLSCVWGYRSLGRGGDSGGPVYWDTVYGTGAAGTITGDDPGARPAGVLPTDVGSCYTQIGAAMYYTQSTVITI